MKRYRVILDTDAVADINEIVEWYNKRVTNLGLAFKKRLKKQINSIKINADGHSIRYKDIRCALVEKFPFLLHFVIYETSKTVIILAVIHTSRSPDIWDEKTNAFIN